MAGSGGRLNDGGGSGVGERGDGGPSNEDLSELRALEACGVPDRCEPAPFVQLIEDSAHNVPSELVSCLLVGLAERRPGRYVYRTEAVFSNGSTDAKHVFVVAADGSVAYVRDPHQFFSGPDSARETVLPPDPAQRCTLKPASYFEACLADVQAATSPLDDDAAWACVFGDGSSTRASRLDWFESCERESPPRCESGAAPGNDAGTGSSDGGTAGDAGTDAAPG